MSNSEFSRAFNSDQAKPADEAPLSPAPADEGVTDENKNEVQPGDAAPEGASETPAVAVVIGGPGEGGEPAEGTPEEESGESPAEEQSEVDAGEGDAGDGGDVPPEDTQRAKSWEGRLKKREEELAAREAAMGNGANCDTPPDDEEVAALKQKLAEDFGQEFVDMICKLAAYEAKKNGGGDAGGLSARIDEVVSDFQGALQSQHLADISAAHEDFIDIVSDPAFGAWIETLDPDQQAKAAQVIEKGSAGQCIKLLNLYKDAMAAKKDAEAAPPEDTSDAEDAAGGVRGSAPLTLPSAAPASGDDEYKRAWDAM